MDKIFTKEELTELEKADIRGGFISESVQSQDSCTNNAASCGGGSQPNCINTTEGCGATVDQGACTNESDSCGSVHLKC